MRLKIKRLPLAAAVLSVAGVAGFVATAPLAHAAGTSRYVSTTGTDSGDCSVAASPCATIQYAVNQAVAGDTVNVAAGTYTETVNITKSITLKGAQAGTDARNRSGAETVVQVPSGGTGALGIQADNVIVDGFTIDGNGENATGIAFSGTSNRNARVVNNIIKNNRVGASALYTDVSGLLVKNNRFDANNVTGSGSDGLYIANATGDTITVTDNSFKDTDLGTTSTGGDAINIYGSGTPQFAYTNLTIAGNTSENDFGFIAIDSVKNLTISNNTATNERKPVVALDRNLDTVTLSDNTFTNSPIGVQLRGDTPAGGTPLTNFTATGNTITGMTTAGIQILADAVTGDIVFTNNTITGNKVGLDNQSNVTVDANDNDWGCAAGPGNPGCDSVDGKVTVASWVGQKVPGVPNTGVAEAGSPLLIAEIAGIVAVLAIGGIAAVRYARR